MTERDITPPLDHASGDAPGVGAARANAGRLTTTLTVSLAAVAALSVWRWWPQHVPVDGTPLRWWAVAAIAVVTETLVFHLEFRREVYTFTFAEVLLVLGLFLVSPSDLIIGRLLGELLVLTLKERQPVRKLALNLSAFFAECVALLLLHQVVGRGLSINAPLAWVLAMPTVMAAEMVGFLAVGAVIRWHGGPFDLRSIAFAAVLTVPVNTSLGLTAGILLVNQPWATFLLGGIAVFVFVAYRSYAALSTRHESLSMLYDFTRLMSGSRRSDAVIEAILDQAKELLRSERAEIWLADEHGALLALQVDGAGLSTPGDSADLGDLFRTRFADEVTTIVVSKRDTAADARTLAGRLNAADCMVATITESGQIVGFIAVMDRVGELTTFDGADARMFETLASHASIALENGRLIERLHDEARQREHDALHDALTGLPNRVLFQRRLRSALDDHLVSGPVAVSVMDLDGFKDINDTLGHQTGDAVLVEVARRLVRAVPTDVTVARLGGDEFALLFPTAAEPDEVAACARRVGEVVSAPLPMHGMVLEVGVSIGLATSVTDGIQSDLLVQRADVAMYSAKASGGGYEFYRPESDENTPRRLAIANDLRTAIGSGQLFCLYQPKARLTDGEIVSVEALVRWRHPTLGMVFPDEFIPLAERSALIGPLTVFVLDAALAQARDWADAGHPMGVAVNLSMRNLMDADLPALVGGLIAEHGVAPEFVTLEITESNVMSDAARTITVLEALANLGVRLSIDDFGTGYSSLSYLQRLPADELKIDKSFVFPLTTEPGADSLVRSIIDLAHNLGLKVVAEGIEDEPTWDRLRALGCDYAQGYFLARPINADEVTELYRSRLTVRRAA